MLEESDEGRREFELRSRSRYSPTFVLADEINRDAGQRHRPPCSQAMQETAKSRPDRRYLRRCRDPFFVIATQNPIEQEGTYPLPEAQVDRFMLMVKLESYTYPSPEEEKPHHAAHDPPPTTTAPVQAGRHGPSTCSEARKVFDARSTSTRTRCRTTSSTWSCGDPRSRQAQVWAGLKKLITSTSARARRAPRSFSTALSKAYAFLQGPRLRGARTTSRAVAPGCAAPPHHPVLRGGSGRERDGGRHPAKRCCSTTVEVP